MSKTRTLLSRGLFRRALAGLLLIGCGGALGVPVTGGESHFLIRCDSSCDAGLDCISGVCTRGCVVKDASCSDLSANALCTADSIEPGAVAVCDVPCDDDGNCRELGPRHACDNGFCRAPSASGGARSCTVVNIEYPSGTQNIPAASGCGTCDCNDGTLICTDQACPVGMPVIECPETVTSDPIEVFGSELVGGALTLDVRHGGGCATHNYRLCYEPEFLESLPVQVRMQLIHDANGDTCEALVTKSLVYDLSALGEIYKQQYQTAGGLISTPYGMYAFGDSECDERVQAAIDQAQAAAVNAQGPCNTAADCQISYIATSCNPGCGAPITTAKAEHLQSVLTQIEANVCGNWEEKGCSIAVPPCVPPQPLACVEGLCVEAP